MFRVLLSSPVVLVLAFALITGGSFANAGEFSGYVSGELRFFPDNPEFGADDHHVNASAAIQPEFYHDWNNGRDIFSAVLFARVDQHDPERTSADIRELEYIKAWEHFELRLGVRKVFWGVTESVHLVDVINQTDLVEGPDGEAKLGQPMLNLAWISDYGDFDLFVMPYFRERRFASDHGRLSFPTGFDEDRALYESSAESYHTDFALRWSKSLGDFDLGLSHFWGTSREPRLFTTFDVFVKPDLSLGVRAKTVPYYDIIHQTGVDLQYTHDSWLLKFEGFSRSGQGDHFWSAAGGFEYTFYGVFGSSADVGILSEYLYDSRDNELMLEPSPSILAMGRILSDAATTADHDLFGGFRFTLNDSQSTELLLGSVVDLSTHSNAFFVEASRRVGESCKITLEARVFSDASGDDPMRIFRHEDFVELEFAWYF